MNEKHNQRICIRRLCFFNDSLKYPLTLKNKMHNIKLFDICKKIFFSEKKGGDKFV